MQKHYVNDKEELLSRLAPYDQQHVLAWWDELSAAERKTLAGELGGVDLARLERLFHHQGDTEGWAELAARALPPEAFRLGGTATISPAVARRHGEEALASGQLGVIVVAGGQGTRLGFDHPKGMYPIGPVSGASLFEILIQKVVARARHYQAPIPLYLMTSIATHDDTVRYLAENGNFGMLADDVRIFRQGTMPAVDATTGQLLLANRHRLCLSPDGHGGMLTALAKSGALDDMRRRGLRQLFYMQVDNPLSPVCDPELIGYHLLSNSELTTLVIAKRHARDNLGSVVLVDGRLRIIEYSDLNRLHDEVVERRTEGGQSVFWAGNTGSHVFQLELLERMAADGDGLPFHVARKQVPHIDATGNLVEPNAPNAIKFERFIFDLLPSARHGIVVEGDRAKTFAPLKNGPQEALDSPHTVQAQMCALHRGWLESAGATVADGVSVEIGPLFALDAEETAARIERGLAVSQNRYFG